MRRRPPRATLFPYTTLCRSLLDEVGDHLGVGVGATHVVALLEPADQQLDVLDGAVVDDGDLAVAVQVRVGVAVGRRAVSGRSEEHTSELQARQYLVYRLLLD